MNVSHYNRKYQEINQCKSNLICLMDFTTSFYKSVHYVYFLVKCAQLSIITLYKGFLAFTLIYSTIQNINGTCCPHFTLFILGITEVRHGFLENFFELKPHSLCKADSPIRCHRTIQIPAPSSTDTGTTIVI